MPHSAASDQILIYTLWPGLSVWFFLKIVWSQIKLVGLPLSQRFSETPPNTQMDQGRRSQATWATYSLLFLQIDVSLFMMESDVLSSPWFFSVYCLFSPINSLQIHTQVSWSFFLSGSDYQQTWSSVNNLTLPSQNNIICLQFFPSFLFLFSSLQSIRTGDFTVIIFIWMFSNSEFSSAR